MATKKIQFFYYNLVDQDSTGIVGGDENAQFPALNLKDPRSTKVYRSNSASDNIVFDFVTVEPVDSILIRGHLFDGFGFNGSLTIEANATDSWGAPAFSTTITGNAEYEFGFKKLDATESYRFWRVSGSGSIYFELADIFIGQAFESSRNISNTFTFEEKDLSTFTKNRYGQRFVDVITDQKSIKGNINLVNKADIVEYRNFLNYVGEKKPFWVILDESECIYQDFELMSGKFYFRNKPVLKHVIRGIYNTSVSLEEAL